MSGKPRGSDRPMFCCWSQGDGVLGDQKLRGPRALDDGKHLDAVGQVALVRMPGALSPSPSLSGLSLATPGATPLTPLIPLSSPKAGAAPSGPIVGLDGHERKTAPLTQGSAVTLSIASVPSRASADSPLSWTALPTSPLGSESLPSNLAPNAPSECIVSHMRSIGPLRLCTGSPEPGAIVHGIPSPMASPLKLATAPLSPGPTQAAAVPNPMSVQTPIPRRLVPVAQVSAPLSPGPRDAASPGVPCKGAVVASPCDSDGETRAVDSASARFSQEQGASGSARSPGPSSSPCPAATEASTLAETSLKCAGEDPWQRMVRDVALLLESQSSVDSPSLDTASLQRLVNGALRQWRPSQLGPSPGPRWFCKTMTRRGLDIYRVASERGVAPRLLAQGRWPGQWTESLKLKASPDDLIVVAMEHWPYTLNLLYRAISSLCQARDRLGQRVVKPVRGYLVSTCVAELWNNPRDLRIGRVEVQAEATGTGQQWVRITEAKAKPKTRVTDSDKGLPFWAQAMDQPCATVRDLEFEVRCLTAALPRYNVHHLGLDAAHVMVDLSRKPGDRVRLIGWNCAQWCSEPVHWPGVEEAQRHLLQPKRSKMPARKPLELAGPLCDAAAFDLLALSWDLDRRSFS